MKAAMVDSLAPHSWADIDLAALQHNFGVARQHAPGNRICAVVKANAYGHGVFQLAPALKQVMQPGDLFAVVTLREGQALRSRVDNTDTLLMRGPLNAEEMRHILEGGFFFVIHSSWQATLLFEALQAGIKPVSGCLNVWFKVNTGMNRLGMPPADAVELWQQLGQQAQQHGLSVKPVLMSHLAMSDDLESPMTPQQHAAFLELAEALPAESGGCTLAASAGILNWPQTHVGIVRPGIMLYGASPMIGREGPQDNLQPVMNLKSRLVAINEVKAGDTVGYGATYTAKQDMRIGIVGIGYGDGYPRHAPSGTPLIIFSQGRAHESRLAGRVSMDMLTVDLTDIPASIGDECLLWGAAHGASLSANRIADLCQTIPYELFCQITGRVQFNYQLPEQISSSS
ncbi:MAG: alanine racemase [Pseudohongiella sp.]|nr:alanine racemase [Pseudohongiella sp.]|tara:strand:- start:218421 stop:219617 length:1197 start_codon:yes stop_codon:yes gene_type:complete